jgi:hypothetical protein
MNEDEKIIAMINYITDPDREPIRADEIDSDVSDHDEDHENCECGPPEPEEMSQLVQDRILRQQLGVGGAMTGPKGVIADHKFHKSQEKARSDEKKAKQWAKMSGKALQSGWLQRQLEAEKQAGIQGGNDNEDDEEVDDLIRSLEEEEEDAILSEYKARRLMEMAMMSRQKRFGSLVELEVNDYVDCIDREDPSVAVVVHLYMPSIEGCRQINAFLAELAPRYPYTKFAKIVAIKADSNFDQIALPMLLVYKGGEVVTTLTRVTDDIDGWSRTGRCDPEAFEEYLIKKKVISEDEPKPLTTLYGGEHRGGGLSL